LQPEQLPEARYGDQSIFQTNLFLLMPTDPLAPPLSDTPLLHEDNGELSLHFGFPTIQSRMLKADPLRLVLDYTRTMMGFLLFAPRPERIAMIGLGGGSIAKYCRHKLPDADFTAVELSPEVIGLRQCFGIPQDSANFRVICADGAEFVRREKEAYDVLLVDGFDHDGQPEQLCSAFFYDNCHAALRENGILVINLCADDPRLENYLGRLNVAFDGRIALAEADEGENMIAFACKGMNFPPRFKELSERLRQLEPLHPVDLDKTAQKLLSGSTATGMTRRKRR
jgi:spermidine synthase